MADIQPGEFLYKRIVNPGLDRMHASHANRHGIQLKSTWMPKKSTRNYPQQPPKSSGQIRQRMSPNLLSSSIAKRPATVPPRNGTPPDFIQDMVIPISGNVQTDEINVQRSLSPRSFCSTTRFKQVPLPVAGPRSAAKTPGHRPRSICSERFLTSVTPESCLIMASEGSKINGSDQSVRLEAGQKALKRCRLLKRTSEVKGYRVDRLYYMSAAPARLHNRYLVDENELKMLRERSCSQMTMTPRLGGGKYRHIVEERGKYQTPGDHYSQIDSGVEEGDGHTFITQPGRDKGHSAKDQMSQPRSSAASSHSGILQNEDENKSKKRIGSSKSVTFSEQNLDLKVVGKGADDSGKESGVKSGIDEAKMERGALSNEDMGVVENVVENVESGIDNAEVVISDDADADNTDVDNAGVDNSDNADVDNSGNEDHNGVDGKNHTDDNESVDETVENADAFSSNGYADGEQTSSAENEENVNIDDESGNTELSKTEPEDETLNSYRKNGDRLVQLCDPQDEVQDNEGSENENIQVKNGADIKVDKVTPIVTEPTDVDALLKMI